jgi:hypothetical protein
MLRGVLSAQQLRDFVALLCRVAWADGAVGPAESARLASVRQRIANDVLHAEELQAWLRVGPPEISGPLPTIVKQAFHNSSVTVAGEDGACGPDAMRVIRTILSQCFER